MHLENPSLPPPVCSRSAQSNRLLPAPGKSISTISSMLTASLDRSAPDESITAVSNVLPALCTMASAWPALIDCLQAYLVVHLRACSIAISKCTSEHARLQSQSAPTSESECSLQLHPQIAVSKCIQGPSTSVIEYPLQLSPVTGAPESCSR